MSLQEMKEIADLKIVIEEAESERSKIFQEYNKAIAPAIKIKVDAVSDEFKQFFTKNSFEMTDKPKGIEANYKSLRFQLEINDNKFRLTDSNYIVVGIKVEEQGKSNSQMTFRHNPSTDEKNKLEERLKDIKEEIEELKIKTTNADQIKFNYSVHGKASKINGRSYNSFTEILTDICK